MISRVFLSGARILLLAATASLVTAAAFAADDSSANDNAGSSADFVIIGAGTAGCAMAARLCQGLPFVKIVILEQGPARTEEEEIFVGALAYTAQLFAGIEPITKTHTTAPNLALFDPATDQFGRRIEMREGSTVGGSSNLAVQWEIPLHKTIDDWGIDGLDSETAYGFFAEAEDMVKPQVPPEALYQNYTQDALDAYVKAGFSVLRERAPFGGGGNTAYVQYIAADDGGRRRSSYSAYLKPALEGVCQDRLTLIQDATVTSLEFDESNTRVVAIKFASTSNHSAPVKSIQVNKEAILSAGPFGSPRLLQLNGIGPRSILQARGITKHVANLPVGQATQIRPLGLSLGFYFGLPSDWRSDPDLLTSPAYRDQWLAGEGGPLGLAITSIIGKVGELGYHSLGFGGFVPPSFAFAVCFLNPESFGNITVVGNDPFGELEIYSNLLDGSDFERMVECVNRMIDVLPDGFSEDFKMSAVDRDGLTTAQWVANSTGTSYHCIGGCAVGRVVNETSFKVIGFDNLRVVDASIIPRLTVSAGPLSSVYMLAEFASAKMIAEYTNGGSKMTKKGKKSKKTKRIKKKSG